MHNGLLWMGSEGMEVIFSRDEDWALVCRVSWGHVDEVNETHWRRVSTQIDMWVAGVRAQHAIEEAMEAEQWALKAKANNARNACICAQAATPEEARMLIAKANKAQREAEMHEARKRYGF
jgi:hypothetical protein